MNCGEWCRTILSAFGVIIALISLTLTGIYQIKDLKLKDTSSEHTFTIRELQHEVENLKREIKDLKVTSSEHSSTIRELQHEVEDLKKALNMQSTCEDEWLTKVSADGCSVKDNSNVTSSTACCGTPEWASSLITDVQHAMCNSNDEVNSTVHTQIEGMRETLITAIAKMEGTIKEYSDRIDRFVTEGFGLFASTGGSPECGVFGYHRNPFTGVCFRLVQQRQSWYAAKAKCEDAGEFLLSFTTLNEARWFRSLQLNQGAGWSDEHIWIALRYYNSAWTWYGKITGAMSSSFSPMWGDGRPDDPSFLGRCVYADGPHDNSYWNDYLCSDEQYYACQKP